MKPHDTAAILKSDAGKRLRIGIVASRFHDDICDRLVQGATRTLTALGVPAAGIRVARVPGAYEIPAALQAMQRGARKNYDALIALGCIVRGETPHFDFLCDAVANGCMALSLQEAVPVAFGVLTVDTVAQAEARAAAAPTGTAVQRKGRRGTRSNLGEEAANVAVEMALLRRQLSGVYGA